MSEKEISRAVNDTCCGTESKAVILCCSGASNVGQIANNLMIELDRIGRGSAFCLAGISAGLSGFLETAKSARTILIDGCPVACGKKVFENYGIAPTQYFIVTEMGIEKNHFFDALKEETAQALSYIREKIR